MELFAVLVWLVTSVIFSSSSLIDNFWIYTPDTGLISVWQNDFVMDYAVDLAPYGFQMTNQGFITYEVECCEDAFLTLVAAFDRTAPIMFEITIGGTSNTKTSLSLQNGPGSGLVVDTPNILHCQMFRQFWLSWGLLGEIRLGTGLTPYSNDILSWTPGGVWNISFKAIFIRTGWGSTGRWIIYNQANPDGHFCGNSTAISNMGIEVSNTTVSVVECSVWCHEKADCLAFNYHRQTQECRIFGGNQLIQSSYDEQWAFYVKCLQSEKACIGCIG